VVGAETIDKTTLERLWGTQLNQIRRFERNRTLGSITAPNLPSLPEKVGLPEFT
jgi:hypothetical protein